MEFIRQGADPFKSLTIGSHNHLKEFYQYIIGLDKAKLYSKQTWKAFRYYANNDSSRKQFDELYFNLLEECEKTGHTLMPQNSRYVFARTVHTRNNFTDHDLILHLWFALPHQIKVRAQSKASITNYLSSGYSPFEGLTMCTGFYLTYIIFRVCSDELILSREQGSLLRRIVTHTYRQFRID